MADRKLRLAEFQLQQVGAEVMCSEVAPSSVLACAYHAVVAPTDFCQVGAAIKLFTGFIGYRTNRTRQCRCP